MKWSLTAGILLVVACRGRFDLVADAPGDAEPAGPTVKCGADLKFPVGGLDEQFMPVRVVPTTTGFAVFAIDNSKALQGWTFDLVDGVLVPAAQRTIGVDLDVQMGAVAKDDQILVAVRELPPAASISGNSRLYSLGPDLAERSARTLIDTHVTEDPLAITGDGTQIAMLDIESGGNVRVRSIDVTGNMQGLANSIVLGTEAPEWFAIAAGGAGYVVSWTNRSQGAPCPLIPDGSSGTTARACNRMLVLDRNFNVLDGPMTTSEHADYNTFEGSVAWSSKYSMAAWTQKSENGDVVRYQIRNSETGSSSSVKAFGFTALRARVRAHDNGFFVTLTSDDRLVAETVAYDGTATQVPVVTTPGVAPLDHTLVQRNGQTVTAWIEPDVGRSPVLRFQAICPTN